MADGIVVLIAVGVVWALVVFFIIRADQRAEKAHWEWMNSDDRIWNQWKKMDDD